MKKNIKFIEDLNDLITDSFTTIAKIEWWLLKYYDHYKITERTENKNHLFDLEDGSKIRLPSIYNTTEKDIFLSLYVALNELSKFHRFEGYFKEQMSEYKNIKSTGIGLQKWLSKNKKLGAEKFVCFLTDYLDYTKDEKIGYLNIYVYQAEKLDIYVDIVDFKNTIAFLETFNELYWTEVSTNPAAKK